MNFQSHAKKTYKTWTKSNSNQGHKFQVRHELLVSPFKNKTCRFRVF